MTPSRTAKQLLLVLPLTLAQLLTPGHAAPAFSSAEVQAQVALVRQATQLLLTRSVHPRTSAEVLTSAWSGVAEVASENGGPGPGPAPVFTGAMELDEPRFDSAFEAYLRRPHARPAFNPAHAAIGEMARSAAEGHTYFLDPERRRRYDEAGRRAQTYAGVGLGFVGPGLVVSRVLEESPAARAGLRPGDAILQVDGQPVDDHPTRDTAAWVRGPVGSHVTLRVRPAGAVENKTIKLERQALVWQALTTDVLEGRIGYIQVSTFEDPDVADAFEMGLAKLEHDQVGALIIDLRGNSGGRLDVGARMLADLLPPHAAAFQQLDGNGSHALGAKAGSRRMVGLPIVVLIDHDSGSMSELFAAALREYGMAYLMGRTTAGNVAGGQLFPLADGSALDVTTSELRSAQGAVLNGRGVQPDESIEGTRATDPDGDDPALRSAMQFLRRSLTTARPSCCIHQ